MSVLALAPTAQAGVSFAPRTDFASGKGPVSVAIGDFNADSDPDLAVANELSNTVSVLLGGAGGSFGAKTDFATGNSPKSVAVGDFNADADLDLAVAGGFSNNSHTVSVLLGGAGGSFGAKTDFAAGPSPVSVAVGDFNADSDPDLAVANMSDSVSVLLGAAGGSFAAKTDFPSLDRPVSVAVGDFNADSDPDLAVANRVSDTVSVLLGGAGGTFAARTDFATGHRNCVACPQSVAVGDFNADNDPDLAVANNSDSSVSVLLGAAGPAVALIPKSGAWAAGGWRTFFFNEVGVGTESLPATLTVTSSGEGELALAIDSAEIGGPDADQFEKTADTCSGRSFADGESCAVELRFTPTRVGRASATLQISDNAPDSPQVVDLLGTGVRPGTFSCQGDTLRVGATQFAVANPRNSPCVFDAADQLATYPSADGLTVSARTLVAQTDQTPDDLNSARPVAGDSGTAESAVEKLVIEHELTTVVVRGITARAAVSCEPSGDALAPTLSSASAVTSVEVGSGPRINVGTAQVVISVSGVGTLHLNEKTIAGGEVIRRAVWLERPGTDVVAGEARAGFTGDPCVG